MTRQDICPCKRVNCPRHGDCAACREHHHTSGSKKLTRCERLALKESRSVEKPERRNKRDRKC